MDSILDDIKKVLGVDSEYMHFDKDIIMAINTAFMFLNQVGVGPAFLIKDRATCWDEYLITDDIESVKSYVFLKTKLLFDPPANSFLVDSINRQLEEMEWRLNVQTDKGGV